jgi:hypothetical protein
MALRSYVRWFRDIDTAPFTWSREKTHRSANSIRACLAPALRCRTAFVLTADADRDAVGWDRTHWLLERVYKLDVEQLKAMARGFALARHSMLALALAALIAPAALARGGTVIVLTPPQPVYSPFGLCPAAAGAGLASSGCGVAATAAAGDALDAAACDGSAGAKWPWSLKALRSHCATRRTRSGR